MAEPSTSSTDQTQALPPAPAVPVRRSEPLPGCYTVVWGRNSKDEPNFIKLSPTFGDGDSSRWPDEGPDMTLLGNDHDKQRQWRKTAGELLAKDLGHFDNDTANHWMLADLPKGYALFQQVTHPKGEQAAKREGGTAASSSSAAGKRLRLDRFIFGHEGRKIRSALSLGKHISWQLFDKCGPCPCDGCKVIGKAADGGGSPAIRGKKRKEGEDGGEDSGDVSSSRGRGRPKLARTAASRAAAIKAGKGAGGKKKGKGREWEDDDDDEDEIMYDEEDDEEAAADGYSSDYAALGGGTRTTSSGRQSKPTSKVAAIESPNDEISTFMTPAPPEVSYNSSHLSVEDVQQDLRMPTCPRVGELVWCRVPLARPPSSQRKYIGDADFSRWPGIVRERVVKGVSEETEVRYRVELLAQNVVDSLEGVKLENVVPYLSFVPANTAHMDKLYWTWEQYREDGEKKGWSNIQVEGWPSVVGAYWRANRIAKCFAHIQIRSLPTVAVGSHLAAKSGVPTTSRSALQEMPPRTRFLTHSHVLYGPELVHVGDFVRLVPGADLGPTIDRSNSDPTKSLLNLSLILHIQLIYRGGAGSPLMARGPIYEMVELPPRNEHEYRTNPQAFATEISTSILKTMPRPFPHHKWRLLSTRGEIDVLFSDICGRYHALNRKIHENLDLIDTVLKRADQQVEKKEDISAWAISKGGYGLNGVDALRLTLAGLCGEKRTTRIFAVNGANGDVNDQLRIAEQQAAAVPKDPSLIGKQPDPKVLAAEKLRKAKVAAAAVSSGTQKPTVPSQPSTQSSSTAVAASEGLKKE